MRKFFNIYTTLFPCRKYFLSVNQKFHHEKKMPFIVQQVKKWHSIRNIVTTSYPIHCLYINCAMKSLFFSIPTYLFIYYKHALNEKCLHRDWSSEVRLLAIFPIRHDEREL